MTTTIYDALIARRARTPLYDEVLRSRRTAADAASASPSATPSATPSAGTPVGSSAAQEAMPAPRRRDLRLVPPLAPDASTTPPQGADHQGAARRRPELSRAS